MVSRRQFLRGSFSRAATPRRPPWHAVFADFERWCDRCGECLRACPQRIIVFGSGGFPELDFVTGECSLCGDCAARCPTGALRMRPGEAPWTQFALIGDHCLTHAGVVCRSCGEACIPGAIRFQPAAFGLARPVVDSGSCTGCGACVAPCPVGAIGVTDTAPTTVTPPPPAAHGRSTVADGPTTVSRIIP